MNCCRNLDEMTSTLEAFLHLPRRVVNERVLSRVKPTLTQEFKNQVLNTRVDKNFHGRIYHSWSQSPLRLQILTYPRSQKLTVRQWLHKHVARKSKTRLPFIHELVILESNPLLENAGIEIHIYKNDQPKHRITPFLHSHAHVTTQWPSCPMKLANWCSVTKNDGGPG